MILNEYVDAESSIFGIPVTISREDNAIIVTDYIVDMYGVGDTISGAIDDYRSSIGAYLEELQEEEDMLGSALQKHLHYLRSKLKCKISMNTKQQRRGLA